jgi:hypothetical protein
VALCRYEKEFEKCADVFELQVRSSLGILTRSNTTSIVWDER